MENKKNVTVMGVIYGTMLLIVGWILQVAAYIVTTGQEFKD